MPANIFDKVTNIFLQFSRYLAAANLSLLLEALEALTLLPLAARRRHGLLDEDLLLCVAGALLLLLLLQLLVSARHSRAGFKSLASVGGPGFLDVLANSE